MLRRSTDCWVAKDFRNLFESNLLTGCEEILSFGRVNEIRREQERSIGYFDLQGDEEPLRFFMKKERPTVISHIKHILKCKTTLKLSTLHELELIRFYQKNSIPVVRPIAWGESRLYGIPVHGFIIQEQVRGREFVDLLKGDCKDQRELLIMAYARLTSKLHAKGLISSIVRVTDLIYTGKENRPISDERLVVIDREKGPLEAEPYNIETVGSALASILIRFVIYVGLETFDEITQFLKEYARAQANTSVPMVQLLPVIRHEFDKMVKKYQDQVGEISFTKLVNFERFEGL